MSWIRNPLKHLLYFLQSRNAEIKKKQAIAVIPDCVISILYLYEFLLKGEQTLQSLEFILKHFDEVIKPRVRILLKLRKTFLDLVNGGLSRKLSSNTISYYNTSSRFLFELYDKIESGKLSFEELESEWESWNKKFPLQYRRAKSLVKALT
ncbi:hypothetical protein HN789_07340 [archaeon]|jgi:hypothetical protein|nr:hypothetical protein [archaeon]MBT4021794.1 hypothetical protein [archaeon]MBT4271791.1 hypothetical protein [archaeon]MBT4460514.1 hypothetical protein [archaeon]MBT4858534.1 hypothetical protein [archaeon]